MVGEARGLGWRYTCSDELALLWDESAECLSRRLQELAHAPVENEASIQEEPAQPEEPVEPEALAQGIEQVAVEFINSSDIKFDRGEDMVTRKSMTIDRFVPGGKADHAAATTSEPRSDAFSSSSSNWMNPKEVMYCRVNLYQSGQCCN